jgi:hypothetical protein
MAAQRPSTRQSELDGGDSGEGKEDHARPRDLPTIYRREPSRSAGPHMPRVLPHLPIDAGSRWKKQAPFRAHMQVLSTPRMRTGRLGSGPRTAESQCAMLPARHKFLTPGAHLEVRLQGRQKWAVRVYMGRREGIEAHSAENCFLFPFFYSFLPLQIQNFNSKRNSFCGKFILGLDIILFFLWQIY